MSHCNFTVQFARSFRRDRVPNRDMVDTRCQHEKLITRYQAWLHLAVSVSLHACLSSSVCTLNSGLFYQVIVTLGTSLAKQLKLQQSGDESWAHTAYHFVGFIRCFILHLAINIRYRTKIFSWGCFKSTVRNKLVHYQHCIHHGKQEIVVTEMAFIFRLRNKISFHSY